jgi:hypothetical protein
MACCGPRSDIRRTARNIVMSCGAQIGGLEFPLLEQPSGLDDRQHLTFGNHVVEADKDRFELSCGGRGDRNFHLHGLDEDDVVAVADGAADLYRKRTDAPRHFGHDLDLWHSILRDRREHDPEMILLKQEMRP